MSQEIDKNIPGMNSGSRLLREKYSDYISDSLAKYTDLRAVLSQIEDSLSYSTQLKDLQLLRQILYEAVTSLSDTHFTMADTLVRTRDYLNSMESDNQRLTHELSRAHELSMTDELTGLPNRRAFLIRLIDEFGRAKRYGSKLVLAMIDLDGFKKVNDEYGHMAGDEVLKVYANDCFTAFRHYDLVSRFGGEEFAVLFPNTDAQGALTAISNVREQLAVTQVVFSDHIIILPSFSAGVSVVHAKDSVDQIIKRADEALYAAKDMGRDCTVVEPETANNTHNTGTLKLDDALSHRSSGKVT